jgi:hypothetical protein
MLSISKKFRMIINKKENLNCIAVHIKFRFICYVGNIFYHQKWKYSKSSVVWLSKILNHLRL